MSDSGTLRQDASFKNLAQEIASGECVIFVGAGISISAGLPSWSQLEAVMREKAGLSGSNSPQRTADCCRAVIGESKFNKLVLSQIKLTARPTELHRRIAGLPISILVTTNYDTLLEQVMQEHGRDYRVLSLSDGPEWVQIVDDPSGRLILKIHGCISRTPNNLVITEEDYLSFAEEHEALVQGLSSILAKRPILFVGYSFSDWDLLSTLHSVRRLTAGNRTNKYYLGVDIEPSIERFLLRRHGLYVFNVRTRTTKEQALLSFFDALVEEFDVPQWLRKTVQDLCGSQLQYEIDKKTALASLFPIFDVVTRMRLAMKIEKHEGIQLPMDRVMRGSTIGDLLDLVRERKGNQFPPKVAT